ncbi:hypothetical protein GGF32_002791 [Allomyces javanicus]|nr:hypothetical protein GGF32_002791 [Allomyces javanicus]
MAAPPSPLATVACTAPSDSLLTASARRSIIASYVWLAAAVGLGAAAAVLVRRTQRAERRLHAKSKLRHGDPSLAPPPPPRSAASAMPRRRLPRTHRRPPRDTADAETALPLHPHSSASSAALSDASGAASTSSSSSSSSSSSLAGSDAPPSPHLAPTTARSGGGCGRAARHAEAVRSGTPVRLEDVVDIAWSAVATEPIDADGADAGVDANADANADDDGPTTTNVPRGSAIKAIEDALGAPLPVADSTKPPPRRPRRHGWDRAPPADPALAPAPAASATTTTTTTTTTGHDALTRRRRRLAALTIVLVIAGMLNAACVWFRTVLVLFPPFSGTPCIVPGTENTTAWPTWSQAIVDAFGFLPTFVAQSLGEYLLVFKFRRLYPPSSRARTWLLPTALVAIVARVASQIASVVLWLWASTAAPPWKRTSRFTLAQSALGIVLSVAQLVVLGVLSASFVYKLATQFRRHVRLVDRAHARRDHDRRRDSALDALVVPSAAHFTAASASVSTTGTSPRRRTRHRDGDTTDADVDVDGIVSARSRIASSPAVLERGEGAPLPAQAALPPPRVRSASPDSLSRRLLRIMDVSFHHTVLPSVASLVIAATHWGYLQKEPVLSTLYSLALVTYRTSFTAGIAFSVHHMLYAPQPPTSALTAAAATAASESPDLVGVSIVPQVRFHDPGAPETPAATSAMPPGPRRRRPFVRTRSAGDVGALPSWPIGYLRSADVHDESASSGESILTTARPLAAHAATSPDPPCASAVRSDDDDPDTDPHRNLVNLTISLALLNVPTSVIDQFCAYVRANIAPDATFFPAHAVRHQLADVQPSAATVDDAPGATSSSSSEVPIPGPLIPKRYRDAVWRCHRSRRNVLDDNVLCLPVMFRAEKLGVLVLAPWLHGAGGDSGEGDDDETHADAGPARFRSVVFLKHLVDQFAAYLYSAILRQQLDENMQQMQARIQVVEAGAKSKSSFLATMSHEVRTPAAQVIQAVGVLSEMDLTLDQLEYVHIIQRAGEQLLAILNDILDFSKLENGKIRFEMRPFDLYDAVHLSVDAFIVPSKRLDIAYAVDRSLPRMIVGDVTRIRQIFNNLLSNAIKFTEHGRVVLSATNVTPPGAPPGTVRIRFCVQDTGCGIAPDRIQRIFERFEQADESITRTHGGTGLGLSICQSLCVLMHTQLNVESTLGAGSRFFFEAEFAIASSMDMARSDHVLAPAHLLPPETLRIGLLRCNHAGPMMEEERVFLEHVLLPQLNSYGTVTRFSTTTAPELTCANPTVDVLISQRDEWPQFDHPVALERMLAMQVPFLVVCSSTADMPPTPCPATTALVTRPYKQGHLMRAMFSIIRTARARRAAGRPIHSLDESLAPEPRPARDRNGSGASVRSVVAVDASTSPPPPPSRPSRPAGALPSVCVRGSPNGGGAEAPAGLAVLVVDDNPINRRMMGRIITALGHQVTMAENGREAVELVMREPFAFVFMDVRMPIMDGFEATRRIIDNFAHSPPARPDPPPIILGLSADAMEEQEVHGLQCGMTAYLRKPLLKKDIMSILAKFGAASPNAARSDDGGGGSSSGGAGGGGGAAETLAR